MSTNTLRGIGQEGDGDGDGAVASDTGRGVVADGVALPPEIEADATTKTAAPETSERELEQRPELRHIRSLDSTIPGTRSLDASVPDVGPSLDAKVPALAATLMGVAAPVIPPRDQDSREKGTVHGRDVHLPVEAQRFAGLRPVSADAAEEDSGQGVRLRSSSANPRTATVRLDAAQVSAEIARYSRDSNPDRADGGPPLSPGDLTAHSPWYEEDPSGGGESYAETKPPVLGRAAIGVAVAAGLSIIVFAIIRVNAPSPSTDEIGTGAPAPRTSMPALPALAPKPPTTGDLPSTAAGNDPSRSGAGEPLPTGATEPSPVAGLGDGMDAPSRSAGVSTRSVGGPRATPGGAPRLAASRSVVGARSAPAGDPTGGLAVSPPPPPGPAVSPPPIVEPPPLQKGVSDLATPATPAAVTTPNRAIGADKARAKPNYDPDSTLPLNID